MKEEREFGTLDERPRAAVDQAYADSPDEGDAMSVLLRIRCGP
ncbi:hypothetical protein ACIQCJ_09445 [Streptomyces sp. NPDC093221]